MPSKSNVDPFIEMEESVKNMVYEMFTDSELLLLLRSNNEDPLNDTDATILRDIANPGQYMLYKGYDVEETDGHRIFLTSNNVTQVEDKSKIMIFPQVKNIRLSPQNKTSYISFDIRFEIWIHAKLWTMSNGKLRWAQIMSRINKIYNKKRNSISINTPPLASLGFVYPKNGWNGITMDFKFTTTNFLTE